MLESLDLGTIITVVIAAITMFAGGKWVLAKGKLKKIVNLMKEVFDVAKKLEAALEDDKITKTEVEGIKKELAEVKGAWKALVDKA